MKLIRYNIFVEIVYSVLFELIHLIFNNASQLLQEAIFRVVAAILHLGNVEFAKGKEVDSSVLKDDKSKFHLQTTVDLLRYECYLDRLCLPPFCFFLS